MEINPLKRMPKKDVQVKELERLRSGGGGGW